MGYMDMLGEFFKNNEKSLHPIWFGAQWMFKPHSEQNFWRWVCTWARACRKPSDLGFDDNGYILPPLNIKTHMLDITKPANGEFWPQECKTNNEKNHEMKVTYEKRCEFMAELALQNDVFVSWVNRNYEADLLEKLIPGSRQIKGPQSDEQKEELFIAFKKGELKQLIIKPKIGAHGLNWQHCSNMGFFPTDSYEQWYQAARRLWRFGQINMVNAHLVATTGLNGIVKNLKRKSKYIERMFDNLVKEMNNAMRNEKQYQPEYERMETPSWIK
jgi:hypothetical protein